MTALDRYIAAIQTLYQMEEVQRNAYAACAGIEADLATIEARCRRTLDELGMPRIRVVPRESIGSAGSTGQARRGHLGWTCSITVVANLIREAARPGIGHLEQQSARSMTQVFKRAPCQRARASGAEATQNTRNSAMNIKACSRQKRRALR